MHLLHVCLYLVRELRLDSRLDQRLLHPRVVLLQASRCMLERRLGANLLLLKGDLRLVLAVWVVVLLLLMLEML